MMYSMGSTMELCWLVKNDFETDGDLLKVRSAKTSTAVFNTYVSDFLYTASGGIKQMKLGNGKWENATFNIRNQVDQLGLGTSPTDTSLWKVNYDYGEIEDNGTLNLAKNTGNIARQTLTLPGTSFVQSYKYDPLYRLREARETTGASEANNWIQNWTYDRYGNRSTFTQNIGGNTFAPHHLANQQTNKFTNADFIYDNNGNVTRDRDGVTNQLRTFVFNADNKQTEVKDANNVTIGQYFYDGEGKRVKKVINASGETTVFVYSAGKLIGEYSTASLPTVGKTNYTTTDHLGSPRVITDQTGQVTSRRDFLPFGEDINVGIGGRTGDGGQGYSSSTDKIRQRFTGYQKDTETSLDFAEARMYENRLGKFTAVDPLLASGQSADPQTFNRYAYVRNQPLALSDPSGECPEGKCPGRYSGTVYTKTVDGSTWYNNEKLDDSWSVFSGTVSLTDKKDNYDYVVFGDGTASGSGWYRIDRNIQQLIQGFGQGMDDVQSGSWKGVQNVPSTAWNAATTATMLPFGSIRQDQTGLPELFIPNPFLANGVSYANDREARWGQQVTAGALAAPTVFAAPFSAAGSSLSSATAKGGLNLFKFGSSQAEATVGWRAGDYFLRLPDKGSPKLNWAQNSGALRQEMNSGRPIFDSYKTTSGQLIPARSGSFLNAERYLLMDRGWIYNAQRGAWVPPTR
ncbi:MAG: RHS repeat-associated core domain-containing protein [Pyrinomonadaceae bacterium]